MKKMIALLFILLAFNGQAYTKISEFSCTNRDKVRLKRSLMPTGSYHYTGLSKKFGKLKKIDCKKLYKYWKNYGDKNCYVNKRYLFSHFGDLGMVRFIKNRQIYFGLCKQTKNIQ